MLRDRGGSGLKALILDARAHRYADMLRESFVADSFIPCCRYEDVEGVVLSEQPDVALVFKVGGGPFPRAPLVEKGGPRWVHAGGAGIDHLLPWDPARVQVTNSAGIHGDIMAQYVLCAMLMVNHNAPSYFRQQAARTWRRHLSRSIEGQTLAIVGFGRIGSAIGALARAAGMRVVGVRSSPQPSLAADRVVGLAELHAILAEADHVAITLPLTEATRGFLGRAEFAALRPGAHLINIARGGIVDEEALLDALDSGTVGAATMDVFATEPLPPESPFWGNDKVVLTPHSSSDIDRWQERAIAIFTENLQRWREGRALRNVVNPVRGY